MAQRTTRCCGESVWVAGLLTRTATPLSRTQSEKGIPVPLGSGHLASDGAERFVSSLAVLKAALQHGDADRVILITLDQNSARRGDTGIGWRRSRNPKGLSLVGWAETQVGLLGDLLGVSASALRQA